MNKVQRTLALLAGSTLVAGATYKTLAVPEVPTAAVVVVNSTTAKAPTKTDGEHTLTGLEVALVTLMFFTMFFFSVILEACMRWRDYLTNRGKTSNEEPQAPPEPKAGNSTSPPTKIRVLVHSSNSYLLQDSRIQQVLTNYDVELELLVYPQAENTCAPPDVVWNDTAHTLTYPFTGLEAPTLVCFTPVVVASWKHIRNLLATSKSCGTPCVVLSGKNRRTQRLPLLDRYGFPRAQLSRKKTAFGFRTGDMVKATVLKGKKAGTYVGRVAIRQTGSFNIQAGKPGEPVVQGISHKHCTLLQRGDGYSYTQQQSNKRKEVG